MAEKKRRFAPVSLATITYYKNNTNLSRGSRKFFVVLGDKGFAEIAPVRGKEEGRSPRKKTQFLETGFGKSESCICLQ